jgi:hypothetical protein
MTSAKEPAGQSHTMIVTTQCDPRCIEVPRPLSVRWVLLAYALPRAAG